MATTGLLERLKDKNFDVKAWLVEDVVRLFGIACYLRDDGDLSSKQIYKALKKEDKRREKERKEILNPKYPTLLVERKLKKQYEKQKKEKEKELEKLLKQKEKVIKCLKEFNTIYRTNTSEEDLVVNLLEEAKEQLSILKDDIDFDIKWCKKALNKHFSSFEKFKKWKEKEIKEEIDYLKKKKQEAIEEQKPKSSAELYKQLVDSIYKK